LLGLQFFASQALAWGDEGHEIIGVVAEHYLTPDTRKNVDALLATDRTGLAVSDTGDPIADEATWADKYRDADNRHLHYIATRNWHFIDLELAGADMNAACFGRPAILQTAAASAGPAQDCVVDKIEQFERELSNPKTAAPEKLLALQFVLHFLGDLHQPLHASDDHDQGGNAKRVSSPDLGSGKLHAFWDTQFVEALGSEPRAVANMLIGKITPAEKAVWQQGTPEQWAMESYGVAKQVTYGALPAAGPGGEYELTPAYEAKAKSPVAVQLSKAGVRLAAVLNKARGLARP
jgi:hypothetical protein